MADDYSLFKRIRSAIRNFKKYTGCNPKEFRTSMDNFRYILNEAKACGKEHHILLRDDGTYTMYGIPVVFDESLMHDVKVYMR